MSRVRVGSVGNPEVSSDWTLRLWLFPVSARGVRDGITRRDFMRPGIVGGPSHHIVPGGSWHDIPIELTIRAGMIPRLFLL